MIRSKRTPLLVLLLTIGATIVIVFMWGAGSKTPDPLSPSVASQNSDSSGDEVVSSDIPFGTGSRVPLREESINLVPDPLDTGSADHEGEEQDGALLPAFMDATGSPESWSQKYAEMPWRNMQIEADQITAYIEPLTKQELTRLWDNNDYTVGDTGGGYQAEFKGDGLLLPGLEWKIVMNDGGTRRYRVSEDQYPDLYELARKGAWLRKTAFSKRRHPNVPIAAK